MAGGFGSLAAMSQANKHNRDLLKSNKKEPFSRDFSSKSKTKILILKDKQYPADAILLVRDKSKKEAGQAQRRRPIGSSLAK